MDTKINILLVEDNTADSTLVRIFLKNIFPNTADITVANSLRNAMELAEKNAYNVIILDLSLPDSSGIETFRQLHAKIPSVPIIVLTGYENEKIGTEAVKM